MVNFVNFTIRWQEKIRQRVERHEEASRGCAVGLSSARSQPNNARASSLALSLGPAGRDFRGETRGLLRDDIDPALLFKVGSALGRG